MIEAGNDTITSNATLIPELTPVSCEYVAADEILVTLETKTGDNVTYTLTTAMLLHMTNLSVNLINNFTGQVLRDLGAL